MLLKLIIAQYYEVIVVLAVGMWKCLSMAYEVAALEIVRQTLRSESERANNHLSYCEEM